MYRESLFRCPECASMLEPLTIREATIDVCPSCQGAWVEWFDGALPDVAREADPRTAIARSALPHAEHATHACPECMSALAPEGMGTPESVVFRCGICAGAFVPRSAMHFWATAERNDIKPTNASVSTDHDANWIDRIVENIRALFSREQDREG